MKKTLITLLAVMSSALGITLDNFSYTAGNATTTSEDATFTYVLTLNVQDLRSLLEKGQTAAWGTELITYNAAGTTTGIVINGSSNSNKVITSSLYAKWGTNNAWGNFMSYSTTAADGTSTTTSYDLADLNGSAEGTGWDEVAGAAITYTFSSSAGTKGALTLVREDESIILNHSTTMGGLKTASAVAAEVNFGDMVTGYYYSNNVISEAEAKEASKLAAIASIPEPATATLSLLALAGLAARRRRK